MNVHMLTKQQVLEFLVVLAAVLVAYYGLKAYVVETYTVPSNSMESAIMTGDRVVSVKVPYYTSAPGVGDIVTFADPDNSRITLVKRVIAVGGNRITFENGSVFVNGVRKDEPYVTGTTNPPVDDAGASRVNQKWEGEVPGGYLWVMGDNREQSKDSRVFGAIPVSSVTGKVVAIYWPMDHATML